MVFLSGLPMLSCNDGHSEMRDSIFLADSEPRGMAPLVAGAPGRPGKLLVLGASPKTAEGLILVSRAAKNKLQRTDARWYSDEGTQHGQLAGDLSITLATRNELEEIESSGDYRQEDRSEACSSGLLNVRSSQVRVYGELDRDARSRMPDSILLGASGKTGPPRGKE